MQRPGRSSEETIVQPWGRVLVPLQGIYNNIFEFFCPTKTPNKWKPERRTARTSPGATNHQLWRRMKACIYPIFMCPCPIFYFWTIKPLPILSQRSALSLRHQPVVVSFAWQRNKAIFSSFTQNSVSTFLFSTCGQRLSFAAILWVCLSVSLFQLQCWFSLRLSCIGSHADPRQFFFF